MTPTNVNSLLNLTSNIVLEKTVTLNNEEGRTFSVSYKLVELELPAKLYLLAAECETELSGVCLGSCRNSAEVIFSLTVRNGVMPCVLEETLREMNV